MARKEIVEKKPVGTSHGDISWQLVPGAYILDRRQTLRQHLRSWYSGRLSLIGCLLPPRDLDFDN